MGTKVYVVELPFKGYIESKLKNGLNLFGETFEQIQAKNPTKRLELVDSDRMSELFIDYCNSLVTEFSEISEEKYDEMLNVLPPMNWNRMGDGLSYFFICEAYTGNLHRCFVTYKGKYYSGLKYVTMPHKEVIRMIELECK